MSMRNARIYCAGPLFNRSEREEMAAIAQTLTDAGFGVFLPHRDGMEFRKILERLAARGWERAVAAEFLHRAIFALDVYQVVVECDGLVWNLNGRTPDEGAVSEAAIAWTLGKRLVAFRDDVRSLIAGRINPLLAGLVDFETVDSIEAIPEFLERRFAVTEASPIDAEALPSGLRTAVEQGRLLWNAMQDAHAVGHDDQIAEIVTQLFAEGAPPRTQSRRPARRLSR